MKNVDNKYLTSTNLEMVVNAFTEDGALCNFQEKSYNEQATADGGIGNRRAFKIYNDKVTAYQNILKVMSGQERQEITEGTPVIDYVDYSHTGYDYIYNIDNNGQIIPSSIKKMPSIKNTKKQNKGKDLYIIDRAIKGEQPAEYFFNTTDTNNIQDSDIQTTYCELDDRIKEKFIYQGIYNSQLKLYTTSENEELKPQRTNRIYTLRPLTEQYIIYSGTHFDNTRELTATLLPDKFIRENSSSTTPSDKKVYRTQDAYGNIVLNSRLTEDGKYSQFTNVKCLGISSEDREFLTINGESFVEQKYIDKLKFTYSDGNAKITELDGEGKKQGFVVHIKKGDFVVIIPSDISVNEYTKIIIFKSYTINNNIKNKIEPFVIDVDEYTSTATLNTVNINEEIKDLDENYFTGSNEYDFDSELSYTIYDYLKNYINMDRSYYTTSPGIMNGLYCEPSKREGDRVVEWKYPANTLRTLPPGTKYFGGHLLGRGEILDSPLKLTDSDLVADATCSYTSSTSELSDISVQFKLTNKEVNFIKTNKIEGDDRTWYAGYHLEEVVDNNTIKYDYYYVTTDEADSKTAVTSEELRKLKQWIKDDTIIQEDALEEYEDVYKEEEEPTVVPVEGDIDPKQAVISFLELLQQLLSKRKDTLTGKLANMSITTSSPSGNGTISDILSSLLVTIFHGDSSSTVVALSEAEETINSSEEELTEEEKQEIVDESVGTAQKLDKDSSSEDVTTVEQVEDTLQDYKNTHGSKTIADGIFSNNKLYFNLEAYLRNPYNGKAKLMKDALSSTTYYLYPSAQQTEEYWENYWAENGEAYNKIVTNFISKDSINSTKYPRLNNALNTLGDNDFVAGLVSAYNTIYCNESDISKKSFCIYTDTEGEDVLYINLNNLNKTSQDTEPPIVVWNTGYSGLSTKDTDKHNAKDYTRFNDNNRFFPSWLNTELSGEDEIATIEASELTTYGEAIDTLNDYRRTHLKTLATMTYNTFYTINKEDPENPDLMIIDQPVIIGGFLYYKDGAVIDIEAPSKYWFEPTYDIDFYSLADIFKLQTKPNNVAVVTTKDSDCYPENIYLVSNIDLGLEAYNDSIISKNNKGFCSIYNPNFGSEGGIASYYVRSVTKFQPSKIRKVRLITPEKGNVETNDFIVNGKTIYAMKYAAPEAIMELTTIDANTLTNGVSTEKILEEFGESTFFNSHITFTENGQDLSYTLKTNNRSMRLSDRRLLGGLYGNYNVDRFITSGTKDGSYFGKLNTSHDCYIYKLESAYISLNGIKLYDQDDNLITNLFGYSDIDRKTVPLHYPDSFLQISEEYDNQLKLKKSIKDTDSSSNNIFIGSIIIPGLPPVGSDPSNFELYSPSKLDNTFSNLNEAFKNMFMLSQSSNAQSNYTDILNNILLNFRVSERTTHIEVVTWEELLSLNKTKEGGIAKGEIYTVVSDTSGHLNVNYTSIIKIDSTIDVTDSNYPNYWELSGYNNSNDTLVIGQLNDLVDGLVSAKDELNVIAELLERVEDGGTGYKVTDTTPALFKDDIININNLCDGNIGTNGIYSKVELGVGANAKSNYDASVSIPNEVYKKLPELTINKINSNKQPLLELKTIIDKIESEDLGKSIAERDYYSALDEYLGNNTGKVIDIIKDSSSVLPITTKKFISSSLNYKFENGEWKDDYSTNWSNELVSFISSVRDNIAMIIAKSIVSKNPSKSESSMKKEALEYLNTISVVGSDEVSKLKFGILANDKQYFNKVSDYMYAKSENEFFICGSNTFTNSILLFETKDSEVKRFGMLVIIPDYINNKIVATDNYYYYDFENFNIGMNSNSIRNDALIALNDLALVTLNGDLTSNGIRYITDETKDVEGNEDGLYYKRYNLLNNRLNKLTGTLSNVSKYFASRKIYDRLLRNNTLSKNSYKDFIEVVPISSMREMMYLPSQVATETTVFLGDKFYYKDEMEQIAAGISNKCVLTCSSCSVRTSCPFYNEEDLIKLYCTPVESIDLYIKDNKIDFISDILSVEKWDETKGKFVSNTELPLNTGESATDLMNELTKRNTPYSEITQIQVNDSEDVVQNTIKISDVTDELLSGSPNVIKELKKLYGTTQDGETFRDRVRANMGWLTNARYGTVEANNMNSLLEDSGVATQEYKYLYNALFLYDTESYISYSSSENNVYTVILTRNIGDEISKYRVKVKLNLPKSLTIFENAKSTDDVYLVSDDLKDDYGKEITPVIYLGTLGKLRWTFNIDETNTQGITKDTDHTTYAQDIAQWALNCVKGNMAKRPVGDLSDPSRNIYEDRDQIWMDKYYKKITDEDTSETRWLEIEGRKREGAGYQELLTDEEGLTDELVVSGKPIVANYINFLRRISIQMFDPKKGNYKETKYDTAESWTIPFIKYNSDSIDDLDKRALEVAERRRTLPYMKTNLRLVVVKNS